MLYKTIAFACVAFAAAAEEPVVEAPAAAVERGRSLFPLYAIGKNPRLKAQVAAANRGEGVKPMMALNDASKGPAQALEMLALNDDLNTVVSSDDMCTRRHAMARAAGLAAGLSLATVSAPQFASAASSVKMGSDAGQLVFVPDEVKVCAGDTITWVNNKGGPHNVVFDEDAIPSGVAADKISMDDQLGDDGATYSVKLTEKGSYAYFCEPHRGAGMNGVVIVS